MEPLANGPSCRPIAPHRLAFAVVMPRSGMGAVFAAPAAAEIITAAYKLGYFGDPKELEKGVTAPAAPPAKPGQPSPPPTPRPSPTPVID